MREVRFGVFLSPSAQGAALVEQQVVVAEQSGFDYVSMQDHPYVPDFVDTLTFITHLAARTSRIGFMTNVLNLPLRPVGMLAKAAASIDLLSGGRFDLGLGGGHNWDEITGLGGPRWTPGQTVTAVGDAIDALHAMWTPGRLADLDTATYSLSGVGTGPAPAHPIRILLGAGGPRMLDLLGRKADGWIVPMRSDRDRRRAGQQRIDTAATRAGRDPADIERVIQVVGVVDPAAPPLKPGVDAPAAPVRANRRRLGPAPARRPGRRAVRHGEPHPGDPRPRPPEALRAGRDPVGAGGALMTGATQRDGETVAQDEASRPRAPRTAVRPAPSERGLAVGEHFLEVHERYRTQMREVLDLLARVAEGARPVAQARGELHELTVRANDWMLGGYCQRQCVDLTEHHGIEDTGIFPHLRASEPDLAPVLDRLDAEHHGIHDLLSRIDAALVRLVSHPHELGPLTDLLHELDRTIRSHFAYEEDELIEPLQHNGFYAGQLAATR